MYWIVKVYDSGTEESVTKEEAAGLFAKHKPVSHQDLPVGVKTPREADVLVTGLMNKLYKLTDSFAGAFGTEPLVVHYKAVPII